MTDPITYGRNALFLGEMDEYRRRLGLSYQGLADILGVTYPTVWRWGTFGPLDKPSNRNAEMITLFVEAARAALNEYPDFAERFLAFPRVAQFLGMPQEMAFNLYRESVIEGHDFGFLGIFVTREDVKSLRRKSLW